MFFLVSFLCAIFSFFFSLASFSYVGVFENCSGEEQPSFISARGVEAVILISESRITDTKPHYESNHHAAPRARIPVDLGWGGRLERCDSERCDSAGASGC